MGKRLIWSGAGALGLAAIATSATAQVALPEWAQQRVNPEVLASLGLDHTASIPEIEVRLIEFALVAVAGYAIGVF